MLLMPSWVCVLWIRGSYPPRRSRLGVAPVDGSEMARSPFHVRAWGQSSIRHHRELCLR